MVHAWGKCCPDAFVLWRFGCWSLLGDADWNERAWNWPYQCLIIFRDLCFDFIPCFWEKSCCFPSFVISLLNEWSWIMRFRWLASLFLVGSKGLTTCVASGVTNLALNGSELVWKVVVFSAEVVTYGTYWNSQSLWTIGCSLSFYLRVFFEKVAYLIFTWHPTACNVNWSRSSPPRRCSLTMLEFKSHVM